jgi:hypothetical protein
MLVRQLLLCSQTPVVLLLSLLITLVSALLALSSPTDHLDQHRRFLLQTVLVFDATLTGNTRINSLGVGTNASGVAGEIRATDNITAYYSSDASLKTNITIIPDALEKVKQIRGVTYDWTDAYIAERGGEDEYFLRRRDVGVIAQEIEAVLPEVVATREDGIKAVKYDRVVALLIEAIKELEAKVNKCNCGCK